MLTGAPAYVGSADDVPADGTQSGVPSSTPRGQARVRDTGGLTLTETVVAMAIAAVVGVIAFPATSALLREHRLATSANRLGLSLMQARTMAIARSADTRVVLADGGYRTQQRDGESGTWTDVGGFLSFPSPVTVSGTSAREVAFASTGVATGARIVLSNGRVTRIIEVNRLGRVRLP